MHTDTFTHTHHCAITSRMQKWDLATGKQPLGSLGTLVKLFSPFLRNSLYFYIFYYLQGFDMSFIYLSTHCVSCGVILIFK